MVFLPLVASIKCTLLILCTALQKKESIGNTIADLNEAIDCNNLSDITLHKITAVRMLYLIHQSINSTM